MAKKKIKKKIYKASAGAGYNDSQAQIIGKELARIGQGREKDVTPELVVETAVLKRSPLHDFFEWDNGVAGEKYRVFQARNIINHLRVIIWTDAGELPETKAFHNINFAVSSEDENGESIRIYRPVEELNDETIRADIIKNALRELRNWRDRYKEYGSIFNELFEEIDEILKVS